LIHFLEARKTGVKNRTISACGERSRTKPLSAVRQVCIDKLIGQLFDFLKKYVT